MKMKAYVLTRYGGPDAAELREVPIPTPEPHEVRIRVRVAALNPVDFKQRGGKLQLISRPTLPMYLLSGIPLCGPILGS